MSRGLAVVTGASSGIGSAFARRLSKEGYDLLLIARRQDRLEALAKELGRTRTLAADLATDDGLRAAEEAIASSPDLVMLVNNAGFGLKGRFFESSVDDHERMHRLHVLATVRLTHAALRNMVPRNKGAVINVSSVAGFWVSPGGASYAATKNWMNVFTEGVWLDLKTRRSAVQIQSLCPGFTLSEFHDVMPMDRSRIPGFLWTSAEDVVEASLKGLTTGELFVIPGWPYRLAVALMRLAPRSAVRAAARQFSRRLKRTAD